MMQIGEKIGLSIADIGLIDHDKQNIDLKFPEEEIDRFGIFIYLMYLMKIDDAIVDEEIELSKKIGLKLGLNLQLVDEVVVLIKKHENSMLPEGIIQKLAIKYLN